MLGEIDIDVYQIMCASGEEWTTTLYEHYGRESIQINHNPYTDMLNALFTGVHKRTIWIGKFDNKLCKGVVVDRRKEVRDVPK